MNDPVDWDLAERIATRVANRRPGPPVDAAALQADLGSHAIVAEPLIEATTGLRSAYGPARVVVVDRAGWATANVGSFRRLLLPLTEQWAARMQSRPGGSKAAVSVTRRIAAIELGTLLGWLSRRVLGQYDLLVAADGRAQPRSTEDAGATRRPPGKGLVKREASGPGDTVYIVGPNLVGLESKFGFPPSEFRLWVMLHELTHRAQFTGVPWLRGHYLGLIGDALSLADLDPSHLLSVLRSSVQDRQATRTKLAEGGLAALVATPAQQAALSQISGLMALLEGHGDVTMTRAGRHLIPSAPRFERVLAARRNQTNPVARTIQRLIGIEAKLNQYALGEAFLAAIEAADGERAVDRCWVGPENLPTLDEIRQPQRWLDRLGVAAPVA